MITPGREALFSLCSKGKSGNRLTVAEQHSCCLELVGIQCLSQGHFIGVDSCHHEGILQSQCGFPMKQTARTDTGSTNDILNSFLLVCPLFLPVTRHYQLTTELHWIGSHVFLLVLAVNVKPAMSAFPASLQQLQQ